MASLLCTIFILPLMMGDRIMELVLHRGEKLLCDGAFHIVVGAALGIDVRDFLVKSSLAGPDVPDALQLFLKIILAEKVLRLSQPCVIHHITFDDELFQHPVCPNAEHSRLFGVYPIPHSDNGIQVVIVGLIPFSVRRSCIVAQLSRQKSKIFIMN